MTTATDERQALSEFGEQFGWRRKEHDRADIYMRGASHVHVMWRDPGVLNGGSHYEDSVLLAYTRNLAKIQGWLAK